MLVRFGLLSLTFANTLVFAIEDKVRE